MKLLNVTLVRAYDWEGIYANGKLIEEGHDIDWLNLLSKNVVHLSSIVEADEAWLEKIGSFPPRLSDVNPVD